MPSNWDSLDVSLRESVQANVEIYERVRPALKLVTRDVLLILRRSGANLMGLITTSAVLTAVIGLALQEPIGNVFAGLSLQMDRTLGVGNWIQFGERVGRIEKVGFRSTLLTTRDDDTAGPPTPRAALPPVVRAVRMLSATGA